MEYSRYSQHFPLKNSKIRKFVKTINHNNKLRNISVENAISAFSVGDVLKNSK